MATTKKKRAAKAARPKPPPSGRPKPWDLRGEPYAAGKALVDSLPSVWTWDASERMAMYQIEQTALDLASRDFVAEPPEARALWERIDALRHVARAVSTGQATKAQQTILERTLRVQTTEGYKRDPGDNAVLKLRSVVRLIDLGNRSLAEYQHRRGATPKDHHVPVVALLRREWEPIWPSPALASKDLGPAVARAIRYFRVSGGGRGRAGWIATLRALLTLLGVRVADRTIQAERRKLDEASQRQRHPDASPLRQVNPDL